MVAHIECILKVIISISIINDLDPDLRLSGFGSQGNFRGINGGCGGGFVKRTMMDMVPFNKFEILKGLGIGGNSDFPTIVWTFKSW